MQQKSPPLNYVQGQAVIYLRYHLVWCQAPTLYRMQLHSWSRNADPASRLLKIPLDPFLFFTLPSEAHLPQHSVRIPPPRTLWETVLSGTTSSSTV